MTINKRWLRKTTESMRVLITKEQERLILERFSEEPWPYAWSEQDIVTQILNFLGYGEFVKSVQNNSKMSLSRFDDAPDF